MEKIYFNFKRHCACVSLPKNRMVVWVYLFSLLKLHWATLYFDEQRFTIGKCYSKYDMFFQSALKNACWVKLCRGIEDNLIILEKWNACLVDDPVKFEFEVWPLFVWFEIIFIYFASQCTSEIYKRKWMMNPKTIKQFLILVW